MTYFCLELSTSNSVALHMSSNVPLPMKPATNMSAQKGLALILNLGIELARNCIFFGAIHILQS